MSLQSLFLVLIGLAFGSFISAVSYRFPKKISFIKGRSRCPNCKHQIAWYDNMPVVSYILLGGKCRNCGKYISLRYPIIEVITAIGFVALTFKGASLQGVYSIVILLILEAIFIIDLEHQIIPDSLIFLGILVFFLYSLFVVPNSLFPALFAGFASATILLLIHLFTKGRGMGLGDVKFAVLGGMLAGIGLWPIWLFLAFLTGGCAGFILILGKRAGLKDKIAFGPFLVVSLVLTAIFGNQILILLGF